MPVRADLLDEAFSIFCKTGGLPHQDRLAAEVMNKTLERQKESLSEIPLRELTDALRRMGKIDLYAPSLCRRVFAEALSDCSVTRMAARYLLIWEVRKGGNVTTRGFLEGRSPPEFGPVGVHLLGFWERLAKPPYEAQARRLMARIAATGRSSGASNPTLPQALCRDAQAFLRAGHLPQDPLTLEYVLIHGEMLALACHYLGVGDPELLAAFDAAAKESPQRQKALTHLQELMKERRLFRNADLIPDSPPPLNPS
jgi:hypothetical protein